MDEIWITDLPNKGNDDDNRNAAMFVAILLVVLVLLCLFAPNAHALA